MKDWERKVKTKASGKSQLWYKNKKNEGKNSWVVEIDEVCLKKQLGFDK